MPIGRRPEDDVEEGQHHPEKKGRDADKQGQERHSLPFSDWLSAWSHKGWGVVEGGWLENRPYGAETQTIFLYCWQQVNP